MGYTSQSDYSVRFEWGLRGLNALAPSDAVAIIDVLSFSTCVDLVVAQGGAVYPCAFKGERAELFAKEHKAVLARPRADLTGYSLSPASLKDCRSIDIVLPSPNGSEITTAFAESSDKIAIYSACLRNAKAVAQKLGTTRHSERDCSRRTLAGWISACCYGRSCRSWRRHSALERKKVARGYCG
jgi:2-phosphosulfolactate phosphatase